MVKPAQQGRRELPADWPLESNQDNFTHYYSRRTRQQGERDLQNLAAHATSATKEEVWFYFEGISHSGSPLSYWYEIGMGETEDRAESLHRTELLRAIMRDFQMVNAFSGYHFHPRPAGKNAGLTGDEYPSPIDIRSYLVSGETAEIVGAPEVKVDFRVVTKSGVYVITPNYADLRDDISLAQGVLTSYESEFYRRRAVLRDQIQENRNFALRTSTARFRIEFRLAGEPESAQQPAKKKR